MTFPLPNPVQPDQPETERNFAALAQVFPVDGQSPSLFRPPRTVTSLPSSSQVFDGMEIYYVADSTNGVVWHLKYRAGSGSSYKWEFVGGSPLTSDGLAQVGPYNYGATTYGYFDSAVAVTVPLEGDYRVGSVLDVYISPNTGHVGHGIKVGASNWSLTAGAYVKVTTDWWTAIPVNQTLTGVAASTTLTQGAYVENASTATYRRGASMAVVPVRVR